MDWRQLHSKGCQKAVVPPAHKFTREGDLWWTLCRNAGLREAHTAVREVLWRDKSVVDGERVDARQWVT